LDVFDVQRKQKSKIENTNGVWEVSRQESGTEPALTVKTGKTSKT
jgi:hypothetical protein